MTTRAPSSDIACRDGASDATCTARDNRDLVPELHLCDLREIDNCNFACIAMHGRQRPSMSKIWDENKLRAWCPICEPLRFDKKKTSQGSFAGQKDRIETGMPRPWHCHWEDLLKWSRTPHLDLDVRCSRRQVLKGAAAIGAAGMFPAIITRRGYAADMPTVVNSIRSLSNPYHATWNAGGAAFAKSVGAEYVTLVTEGNSEKGIADIKAILAKTGGNCVINVDPNDSPDARPIVEACKEAGAYVVTQWNKPADLHPWDYDPNYVAHISFSGVPYGKAMAEALFKAMGGKGGIVALGGIESNVPAIERKAGLEQALNANPGHQASRLPGRQLVGDRGSREDQCLADAVR